MMIKYYQCYQNIIILYFVKCTTFFFIHFFYKRDIEGIIKRNSIILSILKLFFNYALKHRHPSRDIGYKLFPTLCKTHSLYTMQKKLFPTLLLQVEVSFSSTESFVFSCFLVPLTKIEVFGSDSMAFSFP